METHGRYLGASFHKRVDLIPKHWPPSLTWPFSRLQSPAGFASWVCRKCLLIPPAPLLRAAILWSSPPKSLLCVLSQVQHMNGRHIFLRESQALLTRESQALLTRESQALLTRGSQALLTRGSQALLTRGSRRYSPVNPRHYSPVNPRHYSPVAHSHQWACDNYFSLSIIVNKHCSGRLP